MLTLKKLTLHNYLAIDDAVLNLENRGVVLIEGKNTSNNAYQSNGAGKSSLLSGVTFALYGKTVEGLSGDAVINRHMGTDCHVFLDLDKDGVAYRIERYRKGKAHNGNKVKLFANDTEVTTSRAALTNEKIEGLLGVDFGTYVNTIAYGQGDEPVFSQATDKGKKEILENLANIGIYEQAKEVAKAKMAEANLQVQTNRTQQQALNSKLSMVQRYADQAKAQVAQQQAQKEQDAKQLKELDDQHATGLTELDSLADTIKQKHNAVIEFKSNNAPKVASELSSTVSQQLSQYNALMSSATTTKRQVADTLQKLKDAAAATNCPVCGAPLDATHREQEVSRLQGELADLASAYKDASAQAEALKPELEKQQADLKQIDASNNAYYAKLRSVEAEEALAQRVYNDKQTQIDIVDSQRNSLIGRTYNDVRTDYSADIKSISEELAKYNDAQAEAETVADNYKTLVGKVFARSGVPSMALDLVVPFLNVHTNHYLAKLSGSLLRVNMSTQTVNSDKSVSDKFDIQVQNESGANSYQGCSTGEKKRIDIAIAFAIQDLQNSKSNMATNIAIYDECFDGLDAIGAETVIELLKEKAKTVGSIFVITHNDTLKPFFDSVITVEKGHDGISHVIGG